MCRKISLLAKGLGLAVLFFFLPVTLANQGEPGYFVGVHGGVALPNQYSSLLQDGYSVGAQYGYRLKNFRTALSVDYVSNDFNSPADGRYNALSIMADFYYDFNYAGTVVPFLGLGIGYINPSKDNCTGSQDCDQLTTDNELAYQALLGIGLQHDQLRFDVQYRYLGYDNNNGFAENIIEGVLNFFL